MVAPIRRRSGTLAPGARIAVVGGGPAGSAFALFALHHARQIGSDLEVTIFEPRDFSIPGARGCNMCAGLIPLPALRPLSDIGVTVPPEIVRQRIGRYTLHTVAGTIPVTQPDPDSDVISVYRGSGPLLGPPWPHAISFDGFLLAEARSRGAEVVAERVTALRGGAHPQVVTPRGTHGADLVVMAAGINRSVIDGDLGYRHPPKRQMAQCEVCLGTDAVAEALGGSVHIVLARHQGLSFGTLIPKGPCINVSLMGDDLPAGSLARFLELPEVDALLPNAAGRACDCRPRIPVGPARPLHAERFVAIGDAGVSRLYKNGIGSAILTAERAARTAVLRGVGADDFRRGYGPLCREIVRDNRIGRFLFTFSGVFSHNRFLTLPHLLSVVAERDLPPEARLHSRFLWAMFTGASPYRQLLAMALDPRLQARLLQGAMRGLRGPRVRATRVSD